MPAAQYLTRRKLAEFLSANGYPISLSHLNTICAPASGEGGPPVSHYAGQRAIYDAEQALAWARAYFAARRGRYAARELAGVAK